MIYAVEPWDQVQPEIAGLIGDHWRAVALNHNEVPLDVDWDYYMRQHKGGALHVVTVRDEDKRMVGYHLSLLMNHPRYKTTLHAMVDVYWLKPEYRKGMAGVKLFKFFEESVKARGAKKIFTATKKHLDLGVIFDRLGYKPVETVYTKVLRS